MKHTILVIAAFAVIELLLLGAGIGVGYLLCWAIPEVEIGTGIVIGVLATSTTSYLFVRVGGVVCVTLRGRAGSSRG